MRRGELAQRVAVAAVGIPLVAAAVFIGGWILGALVAVVALGATLELYRLAERNGVKPLAAPGALTAAGFVLVATARPDPAAAAPWLWGLAVALLLGTAAVAVRFRGIDARPLEAVAVTLAGAVLTGGTLGFAIFLRYLDPATPTGTPLPPPISQAWLGTAFVGFPLVTTWLNDTGAYTAGRRWGRRKLSPRVSPGKTVEGAVAGLAAAVAAGGIYFELVLRQAIGLGPGFLAGAAAGLLVGVAAQTGDLAESLMKREAGVKDSGRLLPGHGGLLDRCDALLFTFPVSYLYLCSVLGTSSGSAPWP